MSIDSFNPREVWSPFGAFSMVALQGQGQVVYLKGQVSLDSEGNIVGANDMQTQVRKALENISLVLASVGGEMEDIFSLTHHVTDMDAFMQTGDIRNEFFGKPYPVTTTVEVVRLYDARLLVEITAMAEVPQYRFRRPEE